MEAGGMEAILVCGTFGNEHIEIPVSYIAKCSCIIYLYFVPSTHICIQVVSVFRSYYIYFGIHTAYIYMWYFMWCVCAYEWCYISNYKWKCKANNIGYTSDFFLPPSLPLCTHRNGFICTFIAACSTAIFRDLLFMKSTKIISIMIKRNETEERATHTKKCCSWGFVQLVVRLNTLSVCCCRILCDCVLFCGGRSRNTKWTH